MARRRNSDPRKTMKRRLKDGRGRGHGPDYIPYLMVRDVSSQGFSSRVKARKTGRVHHLHSNLERNYFFYLEWQAEVVDIREQYPISLGDPAEIAKRLRISPRSPQKLKVRKRGLPIELESPLFIWDGVLNNFSNVWNSSN